MVFSLIKRRVSRNSFRYPAGKPPRTAILVDWFYLPKFRLGRNDQVRVFADVDEAARFKPEAIAATPELLLNLNRALFPNELRALISLTKNGDRLLTVSERDQLWRRFHVPIFEQIVGPRGELLAMECDAHDGLHVHTEGWRPDDAYHIDHSACACGLKQPRLFSPRIPERIVAVAAYAR